MIVTSDIANIIYRDCQAFGIYVCPDGEKLKGEIEEERIVIRAKKQIPSTYWKKCFVEVNICVPDLKEYSANSIRLGELEREANSTLDDVLGVFDGTAYRYSIYSIGREKDTDLKCHFVNVKLLFEVLNVK